MHGDLEYFQSIPGNCVLFDFACLFIYLFFVVVSNGKIFVSQSQKFACILTFWQMAYGGFLKLTEFIVCQDEFI